MLVNQTNFSYTQPQNYKKENVSFTAKNPTLKEIDDIRRLVNREFSTYLGTKLAGFSNIHRNRKISDFSGDMIENTRRYYLDAETSNKKLYRELYAIKHNKTACCAEYSDAAYVALRLNGYENVERMNLFAFNPVKGTMRDLDHTVVGVNFEIPKNYEYCPSWILNSKKGPDPKYRINPNRDAIILDAWVGITDYAKEIKATYCNHRGLIKNANKNTPHNKTLLLEGEELCYVPIKDGVDLTQKDLSYLNGAYKDLVKPCNKKLVPVVDISNDREYHFPQIRDCVELRTRYKNGMKNSPSDAEYEIIEEQYMQSVYERIGLVPIKEKPVKKKSFCDKALALFKKIF
ncbi:MAG: hypothetical protein K6E29_01900 [Cyanobacteria bacterium RUI128]|nr:hypothetical protein [Cyanobacteria bacterium RUI128]